MHGAPDRRLEHLHGQSRTYQHLHRAVRFLFLRDVKVSYRLGWAPDLLTRATLRPPAGTTVVGIDEETALVDLTGGGRHWQVYGRQQAWVLGDGARRGYPAGADLHAP